MIKPMATGTVERPSTDLRRPRGREPLSTRPTTPVDDPPTGSIDQRAENTREPAAFPPETRLAIECTADGQTATTDELIAVPWRHVELQGPCTITITNYGPEIVQVCFPSGHGETGSLGILHVTDVHPERSVLHRIEPFSHVYHRPRGFGNHELGRQDLH